MLSWQSSDSDSSQSSGNDLDGLALFDEIRMFCNVMTNSDPVQRSRACYWLFLVLPNLPPHQVAFSILS